MEKALTIIIPAYNVSAYIEQGMDSLLADKSIISYLDIIIVNDGSKDDTLNKANKYVDMYPESVSVIDKENGGHGSGINVGIKSAKGKYLKVLDGDDWVKPEGLKELVEYIVNTSDNPDAIVNPFEKVWEDGKRKIITYNKVIHNTITLYIEVNKYGYTIPLHALTLNRRIYTNYDIPAIDEGISYDDMEYILYPVPYIRGITFLNKVLYEYRLGTPGQSMNPEQMKKKLPMHSIMIDGLARYYRDNEESFDSEQKRYFLQEFVDTFATNLIVRIETGETYQEINDFIKKYEDFPLSTTRNKRIRLLYAGKALGYKINKIL